MHSTRHLAGPVDRRPRSIFQTRECDRASRSSPGASLVSPGEMLLMLTTTVTSGRALGLGYACAVVILYSGFVIVSRYGLTSSLRFADLTALRVGVAGVLLAPILIRYGLGGVRPGQALVLAALGGFGFALFIYAGLGLAPAAHGSILTHGTLPLSTMLLSWLFLRGDIGSRQMLALATIASGIVFMAIDGLQQPAAGLLPGVLCLLVASFCWSGYGLYVRHLGLPASRAAAIVAGISAIVFLPVYFLLPGPTLQVVGWGELLVQGVYQGVLIGALSVFIYTRAVALLGSAEIAMFTASVPVVTTLGGYFFLDERPTVAALLGLSLVTLGLVLSLKRLR